MSRQRYDFRAILPVTFSLKNMETLHIAYVHTKDPHAVA